jgi:23S rRNA pseudouridine1911/1915/1917 synthase
MHILLDDPDLVAVAKPAGIATQRDKTNDTSLLEQVEVMMGQSLYVVHRLDRPVSGIVVFAKHKKAAQQLSAAFQNKQVQKTYLAAVAPAPPEPQANLVHFFAKNEATNKSTAYSAPKPGRERAELAYTVLGNTDRYCLVAVNLITGKHHQIRAQLAAIGCPIKGDVKYGARRGNPDRSIHLHGWKIAFPHPTTGAVTALVQPLPDQDTLWAALNSFVQ